MTATTKADRLAALMQGCRKIRVSTKQEKQFMEELLRLTSEAVEQILNELDALSAEVERLRAENAELREQRVKLESWVLDEMRS